MISVQRKRYIFSFLLLAMHPLLVTQKSSVNCSLKVEECLGLIGMPYSQWKEYHSSTLVFVSLLWHFYETCHAKNTELLNHVKKVSKSLVMKRYCSKIIHEFPMVTGMFAKRQLSNRSNFHLRRVVSALCVKITHSCNHIVDIIISSEQHASLHSSGRPDDDDVVRGSVETSVIGNRKCAWWSQAFPLLAPVFGSNYWTKNCYLFWDTFIWMTGGFLVDRPLEF